MCILSNFIVFFKLIKVHFLVSELYIYQNARCNDKKKMVVTLVLQFFRILLLNFPS